MWQVLTRHWAATLGIRAPQRFELKLIEIEVLVEVGTIPQTDVCSVEGPCKGCIPFAMVPAVTQ
jgi:hypothetical protein